jgi:hypothetical protein
VPKLPPSRRSFLFVGRCVLPNKRKSALQLDEATVRVQVKYGFGGMRRLDLEAGTNSDGKVKFAGLPDRVQRPRLAFHASKDEFEGVAAFDPSTECRGKHDITLAKSKAQDGH